MGMGSEPTGEAKALAALSDAERLTRKIVRDLRRRAIADQLALGGRPEPEHTPPGSMARMLAQPAWAWMLLAVLTTVIVAPFPGILPVAAAAAMAALVFRTCLTVQYAPQLFAPDPAALAELKAALEDSSQAMRALPADSYRQEPQDWVGEDPSRSQRPWTELRTITRTAAALRRRALPPGEQ